jgi:hypothetical protein
VNEQGLFFGVVAVALYNGLFSPFTFIVLQWAPAWLPGFVPFSVPVALYGASLIVATTTLLLSGVPAALFERWRGLQAGSGASCLIWLIGAILLTLPAAAASLG